MITEKTTYQEKHDNKQAEKAVDDINLVISEAKQSEEVKKISQEIKNSLPINDKLSVMLEAASQFPSIAKEIKGVQEVKEYLLSINIEDINEDSISIEKIESFGISLQGPQKELIQKIEIHSRRGWYDTTQETIDSLIDSIIDTDRLWEQLLQTSELPAGITESIDAVLSSIKLQECMKFLEENEKLVKKKDREKLRALVLEEFLPTSGNNDAWFSPVVIQDIIKGKTDQNDPWISGNIFDSYMDFQENVVEVKKHGKITKASSFIFAGVAIICIGGHLATPYIRNYFEKETTSIVEPDYQVFLPMISFDSENIDVITNSQENIFEQYGAEASANISQEDADKLVREFIQNEYNIYLAENIEDETLEFDEFSNQRMEELTKGGTVDALEQILTENARESVRNKVKLYLEWHFQNNTDKYLGSNISLEEFVEHKMSGLTDDELLSLLEKYQNDEQEIIEYLTFKEIKRKAELELRANYNDYIANGSTFSRTEDEYVEYYFNSFANWYLEQLADEYDERIRNQDNYDIVENNLREQYRRDHLDYDESDSTFEDAFVEKRMSTYNQAQINAIAKRLRRSAQLQNNEQSLNEGILTSDFADFLQQEQNSAFDESAEQYGEAEGNQTGSPNFSEGLSPENSGEPGKAEFWTIHGEIPEDTYFRVSRSDTFNDEMKWEANSSAYETIDLPSKGYNTAATEIVSTFGATGKVDIPIPYGYDITYAQYEGTEADNIVSAQKRTDGSYSIIPNNAVLVGTRVLIGFDKTDEYLLGDAKKGRDLGNSELLPTDLTNELDNTENEDKNDSEEDQKIKEFPQKIEKYAPEYLDNSILLPNPELLPADAYQELVRIRDSDLSSIQKAQEVKTLHNSIFKYSLDSTYSDYYRAGEANEFVLRSIELSFADCDVQATSGISFLRFVGIRAAISSGFANSQALLDTDSNLLAAGEAHGWVEFFNEEDQEWQEMDMTTSGSMDSQSYEQLTEAHGDRESGGSVSEFDQLIEEVIQTPTTKTDLKLGMLKLFDFAEANKEDIAITSGILAVLIGTIVAAVGEVKTSKRKKEIQNSASNLITLKYGVDYTKIYNLLEYVLETTKVGDPNTSYPRFMTRMFSIIPTLGISNLFSRRRVKKETEVLERTLDDKFTQESKSPKTFMRMGKFFPKLLGLEPRQVVEKITEDNISSDLRDFRKSVNIIITNEFKEELKKSKIVANIDKIFFQSRDLHDFLSRVTDEYYKTYLKAKKNKKYKKEKISKIDFAKRISVSFSILITYWKLKDNRQRMIEKASEDKE